MDHPSLSSDDYLDWALAQRGEGWRQWSAPTPSPLEVLSLAEDAVEYGADDELLQAVEAGKREVVVRLFDFMFAQGANPARVLRLVYILAREFVPGCLGHLEGADIAELLFSESRAAFYHRLKLVGASLGVYMQSGGTSSHREAARRNAFGRKLKLRRKRHEKLVKKSSKEGGAVAWKQGILGL